jgi:ech hydrogenase subunit F
MSLFRMSRTITGNLLRGPATRMYPHVRREPFHNTRGRVAIEIEKCIFCGLCQRRCPPKAITVTKDDKTWAIDRLYCMTCNVCTEVCPVHCLAMEREYTRPTARRYQDSYRQEGNTAVADGAGPDHPGGGAAGSGDAAAGDTRDRADPPFSG